MNSYNLELRVQKLEDIYGEGSPDSKSKLSLLFENCRTVDAKEDLLSHLKFSLLESLSERYGCTKIFRGDSASRTAMKVLSLTAKGYGVSVPLETTMYSERPRCSIYRPFWDTSAKEMSIFSRYSQLECFHAPSFTTKSHDKASIDSLLAAFIAKVQVDYPATIDTIIRTAEKLSVSERLLPETQCPLCLLWVVYYRFPFCSVICW